MSEISRVALFGKLNPLAYKAIEGATVFCKLRGNPYVELVHWFHQILQHQDSDLHRILNEFQIDPARLARDMTEALDRLPRGASSISDLSSHVEEAVERGWVYGSLLFGDSQVRTGHLVIGILKTPGLRNIELTAPFFANGGQSTLAQLVDFYGRGGDFPSADVDPNLTRAGFSDTEKAAVVAFLKALTDERVRSQSAPFDHPSLVLPNGLVQVNGAWTEQYITIPATGAAGGAPLGKFCNSLAGATSQTCN
jgi:hypothetical protein